MSIVDRPGRRILEIFKDLQPDAKKRAKALYKQLGKLPRPEIERRLAKLQSEAKHGTKMA